MDSNEPRPTIDPRDRAALTIIMMSLLAGTAGGVLVAVPVGLFVLSGMLLVIGLLLGWRG